MRSSPVLLLLLVPSIALAWPTNGVRLTSAWDGQAGPVIASDAAGGAFVAWTDLRDYFNGTPIGRNDCYLQRVTAEGQIAPGWPVDGLAVGTGPGHQLPVALAPDDGDGVLIVFSDTSVDFGDLYLQRITAAGTVAPGWPATGVPIAVGPGEQWAPELVGDGAGGAFVSWQDSGTESRARYTHVLASGGLAPGWVANGRLFEPGPFLVSRPLMLYSGSGFLAAWGVADDASSSIVHIQAQRYLVDGNPDPAWPVGGLVICQSLPANRGPVDRLVRDGTGGFFTVFADAREDGVMPNDLYAQHVVGSGALAPGWPADGVPVSALPGVTEQDPSLCEDGRGGAYIVWEDYRVGAARVFGQHLATDGQPHPGWPTGGRGLTSTPGFQLSPELAWDGRDGAYLTWNNLQTGGYRSYVQHLGPSGAPAPGWPANGLPVIPLATDQYVPTITADGRGGAIVAWEDIRNGETDVYAQRYITDGVVATQVSVVSAEARADEVRLRWHVSGETRASVERSERDAAEWRALAEIAVDGAGFLEYVDRDVVPGASYEYRLKFASGSRGGETSVMVPVLELALEGARPNPAVGVLFVAFTLPDASAARLELYDLAGRRLASRDVGARGEGRHVVRLHDGAIAPGLYWAALTHGTRTVRTRVAVVK